MIKFHEGWYLIYTKPRHEKKVYVRLNEMQINSFLPTRKTIRKWHDRKRYVEEPLFPSYVFVYITDLENYYNGLNVDGTLYYVKAGKEVARVKEDIVENIRLAVSMGSDLEVSGNHFRPGQQLVIKDGPLTGLSCEVIQYNGKEKFLVRIQLLMRNLLITVPSQQLASFS